MNFQAALLHSFSLLLSPGEEKLLLVVNKATNMHLNRGERGDGDIKDEAFSSAVGRELGSKSFHSTWRAQDNLERQKRVWEVLWVRPWILLNVI